MVLNHIAIACMVAMALPAVFQSVGIMTRGIGGFNAFSHDRDDLTHRQRINYQTLDRRLSDRGSMPHGHSI